MRESSRLLGGRMACHPKLVCPEAQSSFAKAPEDILRALRERRMVGREEKSLNPEQADFQGWDQVFGVLEDWNRSLLAVRGVLEQREGAP